MWQIWLVISGVCFVLEMMTVGFLVFWFAIGALFAMITSLFTDSIIIQTAVFIITSTLLLFLTKPLVKKLSNSDKVKTNAYSVIEKKGIVTREINPQKGIGQVKIGSETWTAKSINENDILSEGTEVTIKDINGVKVIVEPVSTTITK